MSVPALAFTSTLLREVQSSVKQPRRLAREHLRGHAHMRSCAYEGDQTCEQGCVHKRQLRSVDAPSERVEWSAPQARDRAASSDGSSEGADGDDDV
eukprot:4269043-Pleurochrysis_carterae.AAC.1